LTVRLIANLLANAVKYSPDSSAIVMGAKPDGDGGVRLWVQDQGPGVPVSDHDKIFEKFSISQSSDQSPRSLSTPSSGLGLAFCKLAATTQGGTIGIESQPGHGSTFWVVLQATKPGT
jgi:signal transduction histidine kinase